MIKNRKNLGIFIIIIGLIILLLIIYFGFIKKPAVAPLSPLSPEQGQAPISPNTGTTTPGDKPRNYQQYDLSKEPEHQFNSSDLEQLARAFTERFGSYSNQSDYGNFTDLKLFMTDSLKIWSDQYVVELKKDVQDATVYYGISTKALTSEVKSFDEKAGRAQVVVSAQRRESTADNANSRTYTQKMTLDFLKVNSEWLVDGVYWEK